MFRKTFSGAVIVSGVLAVAGLLSPASAWADDKKKEDKPALSGTWGKKDGELKIEFVDKEVMKILPHGDKAPIAIVCEYAVDKEGLVKVKVTELEAKDEVKKKLQEHAPVGLKFTFKWKKDGDAAKLEDLTGDNIDSLKPRLEGDFEKK